MTHSNNITKENKMKQNTFTTAPSGYNVKEEKFFSKRQLKKYLSRQVKGQEVWKVKEEAVMGNVQGNWAKRIK
jgi:hypothetical protein